MTTLVDVGQYLTNLISTNATTLGIGEVTYGDVTKVIKKVTCSVVPDNKVNEWRSIPYSIRQIFTVMVLIHHGQIIEPNVNQLKADTLAEQLEEIIHQERTFGGLVTYGLVTEVASGTDSRGGEVLRTSRLTVVAECFANLPT